MPKAAPKVEEQADDVVDADALAVAMNGGITSSPDVGQTPDFPSVGLPFVEPVEYVKEGRIVHFVAEDAHCKAAVVVRVNRSRGPDVEIGIDEDQRAIKRSTWIVPDDGSINLAVLYDGSNDQANFRNGVGGLAWQTSVKYAVAGAYFEDNQRHTWHWPGECR